MTALVPIVLFPGFFFPFVTTRNIFFRTCVELGLAMVLVAGVRRLREARASYDPILKWFFGYLIALGISAVFGLFPWHSLFGDFERMGGVFAWLHLFLFYLIIRLLLNASDWTLLFRFILGVADLVVAWGAFEFLPASVRNPLFSTSLEAGSTIGNPGLLAPYLLLALATGVLLLLKERRRKWKGFAGGSILLLLFGIGSARNRSSELGLLFGAIVAAILYLSLQSDRRRAAKRYAFTILIFVGIAVSGGVFLSHRAPSMADRFWGRWNGFLASPIDHSRTIEWQIALDGFKDRPILGYGPENHEIVASHHFDPRIYQYEGGAIFDRTHNAWLEMLATTGIVGTVAMIGIWVASVVTLRSGISRKRITAPEAAVLAGALTAYAVYLTFWFFDINSVVVWVSLLAFLSWRVYGPLEMLESAPQSHPTVRLRRGPITWAMIGLIALTAYLQGIVPLIAAHDLSDAASAGPFELRLEAFERVMNSSSPQTLHTFPLYYAFLNNARSSVTASGATPGLQKQFDLALQRGMIEAERSISRNGQDDRSYAEAARFSMLAAAFYRDSRYLLIARKELQHAVRISPRRPEARIFLAAILKSLSDSAGAVAQLDSAMLLAPEYGGGYFFAGKSALARNDPDSAAALIESSLDRNYPGSELVLKDVLAALEQRGEYERAARLDQAYLEKLYGPLKGWRGGKTKSGLPLTPVTKLFANELPLLYLKAGERALAVGAALAFGGVEPSAGLAARTFASQVTVRNDSAWKANPFLIAPGGLDSSAQSTTSRKKN